MDLSIAAVGRVCIDYNCKSRVGRGSGCWTKPVIIIIVILIVVVIIIIVIQILTIIVVLIITKLGRLLNAP